MIGLTARFSVLLDRSAKLIHARSGLLETGCLLLGAGAEVAVANGDLVGSGRHRLRTMADSLHHATQRILHTRQRTQQLTRFIAATGRDDLCKIAFGYRACGGHRLLERPRHRAGNQHRDPSGQNAKAYHEGKRHPLRHV